MSWVAATQSEFTETSNFDSRPGLPADERNSKPKVAQWKVLRLSSSNEGSRG